MIIGNWVDTVSLWGSCGSSKKNSGPLKLVPKSLPLCQCMKEQSVQNLPPCPWGGNPTMEVAQSPSVNLVDAGIQPTEFAEDYATHVSKDNSNEVRFLEEIDEQILSGRILTLSRSNKYRSAMTLFTSMAYMGLIPTQHSCNSLIACLLRKDQFEDALQVFEFMKKNEITSPHTYSLILKGVANAQGCESALHMFTELEEKQCDVVVYNTVISICGRVNDWVEAEKVWRRMNEHEYCGSQVTYSLLVSIFARCGKNELALGAYSEMLQNGLKPEVDTIEIAVMLYSKEAKWDLAFKYYREMLDDGKSPSLDTCHALMKSLGLAGKAKLTFQVFEDLGTLGHKPSTYTFNALLKALFWANRHGDTIRLFEGMERKERSLLDEHSYRTALMSCHRLGLWDKGLQFLWQLESSGLSVSTVCYNLVIGACERGKKADVALQVYERMVQQKCSPDRATYLSLIGVCISASMWSEVERLLDVAPPDTVLYTAAINWMCSRGNPEAAKKLHMKMQANGISTNGKAATTAAAAEKQNSS